MCSVHGMSQVCNILDFVFLGLLVASEYRCPDVPIIVLVGFLGHVVVSQDYGSFIWGPCALDPQPEKDPQGAQRCGVLCRSGKDPRLAWKRRFCLDVSSL